MALATLTRTALAAAALTGGGGAAIAATAGAPPSARPTAATLTASSGPAAPGSAAPSAGCHTDDHWPRYVEGAPGGFDAGDDGVYLWHNPSGGWALRVSHPRLPGRADRVVFTGTITSRGEIGHVTAVRDEKDDVVRVGPDGHTLAFRFVDYGGVDGVDFTTTCTTALRVDFRADGTTVQPQFVHLGDGAVHPPADPFRIRRSDTDPGALPSAGR